MKALVLNRRRRALPRNHDCWRAGSAPAFKIELDGARRQGELIAETAAKLTV
jgi:hypothetical protein